MMMRTQAPAPRRELRLVADRVHKRYGGVHALRGASLVVGAGEVHGLIGENGSGKSTLLKILSGQVPPDRAEITVDDAPLRTGDPTAAIASGIVTVTQETTLVPDLSVADNITLGRRGSRRWYGVDWQDSRELAEAILGRLELDIDARRVVGDLRPDEQQMVEVARALSFRARVLILDEPTSSLTDDEVEALFAIVRRLKEQGVSTVFVSHRMNEMQAIADQVTVLRDGETVATGPIGRFEPATLIRAMVGKELDRLEGLQGEARAVAEPILRLHDVSVPGRVHGCSLAVAPGEIVGLAGLVGAGRSDLLGAAFGLEPSATGSVEVDGQRVAPGSPRRAMSAGLAYVPADRKSAGVVLDMSTRENLMMARTARAWRARRPRRAHEQPAVEAMMEELRVARTAIDAPVATLSGGNQQKVLLGKWLGTNPKVLLLDEPTRGVDVGAKAEIYRLLQAARRRGLGMLVSSSEVAELRLLCDRIVVMFRGRIAASLSGPDATETRITHYATGHR